MSAANFRYSISGSLGKVHIGCTGKVSNELLSLQEDKKKKIGCDHEVLSMQQKPTSKDFE